MSLFISNNTSEETHTGKKDFKEWSYHLYHAKKRNEHTVKRGSPERWARETRHGAMNQRTPMEVRNWIMQHGAHNYETLPLNYYEQTCWGDQRGPGQQLQSFLIIGWWHAAAAVVASLNIKLLLRPIYIIGPHSSPWLCDCNPAVLLLYCGNYNIHTLKLLSSCAMSHEKKSSLES